MSQSNIDQSQSQHKDYIAKFCFQISLKTNVNAKIGENFRKNPENRSDIDRKIEKSVSQHMKVLQRIQFFRPSVFSMVVQSGIQIFFVLFDFSL